MLHNKAQLGCRGTEENKLQQNQETQQQQKTNKQWSQEIKQSKTKATKKEL